MNELVPQGEEFKKQSMTPEEKLHSPFTIGKYTVEYPIVQGGMGVGVSLAPLVGAVSHEGGLGTLASVGLLKTRPEYRQLLADALLASKVSGLSRSQVYKDVNAQCIPIEIAKAKKLSGGKPVFINIMVAISSYTSDVMAAVEAGVDGIVCGSKLPKNLPALTKSKPDIALVPILSTVESVETLLNRRWKRYQRLPDAIILEDGSQAGGHIFNPDDPEGWLENSVPKTKAFLEEFKKTIPPELWHDIPVIAAGGMYDREGVLKTLGLGADAVQLGTLFAATKESGTNDEHKQAIVGAEAKDIVTFWSPAGLRARAINNEVLEAEDIVNEKKGTCDRQCLGYCGKDSAEPRLRQICIADALVMNMKPGRKGLRFASTAAAHIHDVLTVKERMDALTGRLEKTIP